VFVALPVIDDNGEKVAVGEAEHKAGFNGPLRFVLLIGPNRNCLIGAIVQACIVF